MRETPFARLHEAHGARMVDFAGWNMPVQYTSIVEEHLNVRSACGLFDVSHMGRIMITGPQHIAFTDKVATNARAGMRKKQVRYNLICNNEGTILDDVLITASAGDESASASAAEMDANPVSALTVGGTMIVCNAGNHPKIAAWLKEQCAGFDVRIDDITESYAMLALQGPNSQDILQPLSDVDLAKIKYYRSAVGTVCGIADVIVSRTGYTGEDGFELIFPASEGDKVFNALLDAGKDKGLKPTGLGARDTLRLEAGMPLYGHEIDDTVNPLEAGLNWAVKLDKDFNGKSVLAQVAAEGPARKLVGLIVDSKRIARQHMKVLYQGAPVGEIASGTKSPTLDKVIATALIPSSVARSTESVEIEFKPGKTESAQIVELPFYKRAK